MILDLRQNLRCSTYTLNWTLQSQHSHSHSGSPWSIRTAVFKLCFIVPPSKKSNISVLLANRSDQKQQMSKVQL